MVKITRLETPGHQGISVLIDWGASAGPFIALTQGQWNDLLRAIERDKEMTRM